MKKSKSAAASKAAERVAASPVQMLPLFFSKPAALDSERHAKAGIQRRVDLSFARECNSLPLNAVEFIEAARCYPIVFTNETAPVPVAVLAWERHNPFLTPTNLWRDDSYVPAYVRQYPFILFEAPNSDKLYLCVDEAAAGYVEAISVKDDGAMPFYVDGQPSDTTKRALEFANAFYQHTKITRNFCDDLKKHGLLSPYNATATIHGVKQHLNAFLMINETAFNALPEEVFLAFRSKGWLPFIYLALASAVNWKRLMEITRSAVYT